MAIDISSDMGRIGADANNSTSTKGYEMDWMEELESLEQMDCDRADYLQEVPEDWMMIDETEGN